MKLFLTLALIFLYSLYSTAHAQGYILPKSFNVEAPKVTPAPEKNIVPVSVKKTEPLPVVNLSLTKSIRNYDCDYATTFKTTLNSLIQADVIPVKYDSTRGQILGRLPSGKELFILLLPSQEKLTHVRITPANGKYDIPAEQVDNIFRAIDDNLYNSGT